MKPCITTGRLGDQLLGSDRNVHWCLLIALRMRYENVSREELSPEIGLFQLILIRCTGIDDVNSSVGSQ